MSAYTVYLKSTLQRHARINYSELIMQLFIITVEELAGKRVIKG